MAVHPRLLAIRQSPVSSHTHRECQHDNSALPSPANRREQLVSRFIRLIMIASSAGAQSGDRAPGSYLVLASYGVT